MPNQSGTMTDLNGNVVPIPQGATVTPITQPQSSSQPPAQNDGMMTDLNGNRIPIPQGATIAPIQSTVTNSAGETMPADVAARHARSREGKAYDNTPQDARAGIAVGAGKEIAKTVEGAGNLINKVLPSSLELPTNESEINRIFPEGAEKQKQLAEAHTDLNPQGTAESVGGVAENLLEFMAGDEALKTLGAAAKLSKVQKIAQVLEDHPIVAKAFDIGANALRMGTVGGTQALAKGASPGEAVEQGAAAGVTGGVLETAGAGLSALKKFVWPGEMVRFVSSDGGVHKIPVSQVEKALEVDPNLKLIPAGTEQTAQQTVKEGLSAQEAGKAVQEDAANVRGAKGEELGEAKQTMRESLPATSTGEPVVMTFAPESKSTIAAKSILGEVANAGKLSIKDPGIAEVQELAEKFASGKDAAGSPLTLTSDEIDSTKRSLNAKIDALKVQVKNGANGTALGYMKQLKSAFENDLYSFYEKAGDAQAAENTRKLSGEYAKIAREQTKGPAATMLRSAKPEQIVTRIVGNGANSQSAVESLVRNMTPEGVDTLRDSVTKELYRRNTLPDGSIDMTKAEQDLIRMGDAAKSLYGAKLTNLRAFLNAASDLQEAKTAAANASSLGQKVAKAGAVGSATAVGAGAGSVLGPAGTLVGGVAGKAAGEKFVDTLFGKAGTIKIGVSPTEAVTISEKQATQPKMVKLLGQLAKVQKAGQPVAAVLNAILLQADKDPQDQ